MAKKRKNGYYEKVVAYEIHGETKRKHIYYKDEFELVAKVNRLKAAAEEENRITFRKAAEAWQETHFEEIRGGTQTCYTPALKRAIEAFGEMEIADIKPLDIKRLLDKMAKQRYAAQTVIVQRTVLNLIFDNAILNGYLEINPVASVPLPRNLTKAKREIPTDQEIRTVMQSADAYFGMFAYLLLFTGCRRGEALALQWRDIDFAHGVIHINKTVTYSDGNHNTAVVQAHTKTDSGMRSVVMLDCLRERLAEMQGKADDFVFGGEKPLTQSSFRKKWQRYQKETHTDFTPHQLRHAYATLLYDANVDEKATQELMGHSKIQTTKDIYTHIRQTRMQEVAKGLNEYVEKMK